MYFPAQRVDDGYFKVLIVGEAIVAEVLRQHMAVLDCFQVGVEFNSNPVPQRNAIFTYRRKKSARPSPRIVLSPASRAEDHRRDAAT